MARTLATARTLASARTLATARTVAANRYAVDGLPTSLTNLVAWYSARDTATLFQDSALSTPVTANSDPVGGWLDKSGNGRHLTQGTAGSRPAYKTSGINTRAALQFDGSADHLSSTGSWVASVFSGTDLPLFVMAVVYPTTLDANASIIGLGRASTAVPFRNFRLNSSNVIELANRNDANSSTANDAVGFTVTAVPHIFTMRYNGSTTQLFNENTEVLAPEAATTGATTLDTFAVGALVRNTNSIFWNGYIGELIVTTTATEAERLRMHAYLQSRWEVTGA